MVREEERLKNKVHYMQLLGTDFKKRLIAVLNASPHPAYINFRLGLPDAIQNKRTRLKGKKKTQTLRHG
jgi:hypothetical protein